MIKIDKIIKTKRRSISLEIQKDGSLIVRAPRFILKSTIEEFVNDKKDWILKKQQYMRKHIDRIGNKIFSNDEISRYKSQAMRHIGGRVEYYADKFNFRFNDIKINSAKKRWGSCSYNNNLNFPWRLILCPDFVINYVVIHELVHTKIKNHSKNFWDLVAKCYPDFKEAKNWLKKNG